MYQEAETLLAATPSGAKEILTRRQQLRNSMASLMTRTIDVRPLSGFELNFQWEKSRVRVPFTNRSVWITPNVILIIFIIINPTERAPWLAAALAAAAMETYH